MRKKKDIRGILVLIWMIFIFCMSSTPGDISTEQSDFVVALLRFIGIDSNGDMATTMTFIVRKGAHMTEYCILCVLIYRFLILYINEVKALIFGGVCSFLYAMTDEFHQYFVPGRAAAIRDVLIDTSGAIIAIIGILIINKLVIKHKKIS